MKTRDKILKRQIKAKDQTLKENLENQYKSMRNQITNEIKQSKKEYFQNFPSFGAFRNQNSTPAPNLGIIPKKKSIFEF